MSNQLQARGVAVSDDDATRSWLSVVRAYHLCSELLARRLEPLGVRMAEHEILINLRREPGLTQMALARRCFTAKSHASALVVDLERRGWLRREVDRHDARARRLYLAPDGARIADRCARVQADVVKLMARAASPAAIAAVNEAMRSIGAALEAALET